MLVSLYLKEQGINNRLLNSLDFMRLAPEEEPDMEYIGTKLHLLLAEHKSTNVFLTQGHLCRNAYNETCYLKQGGDDVSATLIGAALQAQEVCLWTDSKELHRCDPRFVKHPAMVKQLSFDEAEPTGLLRLDGIQPSLHPARKRKQHTDTFAMFDGACRRRNFDFKFTKRRKHKGHYRQRQYLLH